MKDKKIALVMTCISHQEDIVMRFLAPLRCGEEVLDRLRVFFPETEGVVDLLYIHHLDLQVLRLPQVDQRLHCIHQVGGSDHYRIDVANERG